MDFSEMEYMENTPNPKTTKLKFIQFGISLVFKSEIVAARTMVNTNEISIMSNIILFKFVNL